MRHPDLCHDGDRLSVTAVLFGIHLCAVCLIAGDLLLFVAKQDAKAENTGFSKAQCYIYLGNGIVAGYDPSGKYLEVSGSEAIDLIDSLLGEGVFCVARPSITF